MPLCLRYVVAAGVALPILSTTLVQAQFTLGGQLRTRAEYRNGQGAPLRVGEVPARFISQRTRLTAGYAGYRIRAGLTVQDVRVWGQDASTINRTAPADLNGLMIHEAWGELSLLDTSQTQLGREFALRIGRQELTYDDARLLGNLDWLQQARRHDLALLKWARSGWMLHLGAAYNQNREQKAGTVYNGVPTGYAAGTGGIGTAYKALQFLYVGRTFRAGTASFLLIKDDFSRYVLTSAPASTTLVGPAVVTKTYGEGIWSRVTLGSYANTTFGKLTLKGEAYYQTGQDKDGRPLSAYLLSGAVTYATSPKTALTIGEDYTSGNEPGATTGRSRRFDPLYGTPHKHWGLMDYFYVADGFGPGGLSDFYGKLRYKPLDALTLQLDLHQFASTNAVRGTDQAPVAGRSFGREVDLISHYGLTKQIGLEGGYCLFSATDALLAAKQLTRARRTATWGYLMLNLRF